MISTKRKWLQFQLLTIQYIPVLIKLLTETGIFSLKAFKSLLNLR